MDESTALQLHALLCPGGAAYSPAQSADLAARLRQAADALQPAPGAPQQKQGQEQEQEAQQQQPQQQEQREEKRGQGGASPDFPKHLTKRQKKGELGNAAAAVWSSPVSLMRQPVSPLPVHRGPAPSPPPSLSSPTIPPAAAKRGGEGPRAFDSSAFEQRHVALELLYLGHAYSGFARQESLPETIEAYFFGALRRLRLIPEDATWQELKYSRAGRTDKGVSSLGNVIGILLRSSARAGEALPAEEDETDYAALLNSVLPRDIRVLGWATVGPRFSARFSACHREYKYFIVHKRKGGGGQQQQQQQQGGAIGSGSGSGSRAGGGGFSGTLSIAAMQEAAAHLVGEHDFRNFCKVRRGGSGVWGTRDLSPSASQPTSKEGVV